MELDERRRSAARQPSHSTGPQGVRSAGSGRRASANGAVLANRREEIIEIARKRFSEFGFDTTTVRQIADDANILSGSLYHHFATKDEILHEIVWNVVIQMRNNTMRIFNAPLDAEHRLVALVLLDLGELTRNQQVYTIMYNERKLFARRDEFTYVMHAKKDVYGAWCSILEEGIAQGLFTPDIEPYLTTITLVRMLNAAADSYRNYQGTDLDSIGGYTLDHLKDFYLKFILDAIRNKSRIAEPVPRRECEDLARFRICDQAGVEQEMAEAPPPYGVAV